MPSHIEIGLGSYTTCISVYASNIIRITHMPSKRELKESLVVIRKPKDATYHVEDKGKIRIISTDELKATIDRDEGVIEIEWHNGSLREVRREFKEVDILGIKTYNLLQEFLLSDDEAIFGLGQHAGYSAHVGLNYRGRTVYLAQRNTDIAIPLMVSSKGYGILWDIYSMGVLEFRGNRLKVWFEAGDYIDYYFIYGPSLDRVIASYRWLTGNAVLLPKYAFGYWQSKERYASQEEIVSVAKMFRERNIPIDVIVQDWRYWGKHGWNAFRFDESVYPDPARMVKEIHDLGIKVIISIWPMFGEETKIYEEAKSLGHLIPNTGLINVFKDESRKWFWKKIEDAFFKLGIDGWWLDATEPEIKPMLVYTTWQHDLVINNERMFKYLNVFPLLEARGIYEGQRGVSNRRVLILTRSGFAGIQRYGVINWSGDITGDWTTFRTQIWAGLNYCLSGLPYWTTDIGGFFSGNPKTEGYKELFVRWFEWGTFCPIMRVHGTYYPKEPWRFGSDVEKILVKYIRLRYRLLPYIYSLAWKVYSEGYTIMRHLVMDFPDDEEALKVDDEYMFGPYILVAPITTPSTYSREVYLPKGIWYDFWSGRKYTGGRYINVSAPLDKIPLFVRAGAILPMAPPTLRNAMERINSIELRIYPGKDGRFDLYDDDGETYNYERGEYALIPIEWRDRDKILIIGDKKGIYPLHEIRFEVVIVKEGKGIGIEKERMPDNIVNYKGKRVVLEIP
ncbi:MAG: alpha-xylosidase [Thermoprotei archaeon]|nr:MAG: alpha-xylosidase [Thermoprotei archaeon]